MDATILNDITGTFVDAIQAAASSLSGTYSLVLLTSFATIAFYVHHWPLVMSGHTSAGDALASVLLTCVKTGVFYWLLFYLPQMAGAAFETFFQWGSSPSGEITFMQPAALV